MTEQLLNHIRRHNLCKTTDKILLAVSGGIDSMVLLHLFRQAGFSIGVVHCNFQLRGEASVADEALVADTCKQQQIPFYVRRFDTENYAWEKSISIQMAARELRYVYFDALLGEHGYQYLATAHHLNDNIETTLLHFIKGTGLDGLVGIPSRKNKIIRPLLFATREMLTAYAALHHILWREDESNTTDDYQRNFIRHQVIPKLKEINPGLEHTFQNTLERLIGAQQLVALSIEQFRKEFIHQRNTSTFIDREKILLSPAPATLLWELIKDKGFNYTQCQDIVGEHQSGTKFYSGAYEFFIDRGQFVLCEKKSDAIAPLTIEQLPISVKNSAGQLHFEHYPKETFLLEKDTAVAQLDFDKVKYPLVWRAWQPGDFFIPLGMHHSKKLSDFLIDAKIPLPEKEKVTVLESDGTIIWVVGLRIHDHFKVTGQTSRVLTLRFSAD